MSLKNAPCCFKLEVALFYRGCAHETERRNENAHCRLYINTADQQNKCLQSFILYLGEITKLGRNATVLDFFNTSFTRVSCALLLQSYFRQ